MKDKQKKDNPKKNKIMDIITIILLVLLVAVGIAEVVTYYVYRDTDDDQNQEETYISYCLQQ
ncbi:MAG: hypothetical protein LUD27_05555 [Clostridia bacterium]|nr:hypothetical protein [Clostridia bacterium]